MVSEQGAAESGNAFPCCDRIRVLDDEPARRDEFGAHEALAAAIARLVENEPGGKAIALEGTWGSGKSTVVELLKKRLEQLCAGKVFLFDGWAHEGDSLRRALVEEFAAWVEEQGLVAQKEKEQEAWKDLKGKVDDLARRRTGQTVTAAVKLTAWGRAMVILLALVPVGVVLAEQLGGYLCWLGIILVTLPALLLLFALLLAGLFRASLLPLATSESGGTQKRCAWDVFDAILGIFLRQVEKETKTQGWSTPDPTSIEFAATFRELLVKVLHWMDHRRLVVVLDNLDRLPGREAMRAFATLRVVFEPGLQKAPWIERFWLLVPYDPASLHGSPADGDGAASISGLFSSGHTVALPATSAASESFGKEIEKAFRHKFFQVSFQLPQPVLLRWREYLKNRLKDALPAHDEPTLLDDICGLFTLVRDNDFADAASDPSKSATYRFPTPRDIRLFVNRLAAIHMQWPCEKAGAGPVKGERKDGAQSELEPIPLILQASFVLCEQRLACDGDTRQADLSASIFPAPQKPGLFKQNELRLIERAIEEQKATRKAAAGGGGHSNPKQDKGKESTKEETAPTRFEWERHVAAMWYGVPQEEALHMLLRPQIHESFWVGVVRRDWIRDAMPYERMLQSREISGFWEVTKTVAREEIGQPDAGTFERCANTLAVLSKWQDRSDGWRDTWQAVAADAIRALESPHTELESSRFSEVCGQNFAVAIGIPEADRDLARVGLGVFGRAPDGAGADFYQKWAWETVAVMDAMVSRQWDGEVLSFKVPRSLEAFIFLAGAAHGHSNLKQCAVHWIPSGGPDAVIAALGEAFEREGLPLQYALAFDWLVEVHPDWPWERIADTVRRLLLEGKMHGNVRLPLVRAFRKLVEQRKDKSEDWVGLLRNLKGTISQMIQTKRSDKQTVKPAEKEQMAEEINEWEKILGLL